MKKSTTTIETCRTELTLTLWNKGNKETYNQKLYVFTPKVPITIETAEKLVKQKHYFIPVSESKTPIEDLERLDDSIVLDIQLGEHKWLSRQLTADEWYYSGCAVKPAPYSICRNMHIYSANATIYNREHKIVETAQYTVKSFRSITTDTIKKQIESEISANNVLLDIDMDNVKEEEKSLYMSELLAYCIWC